MEDMELKGLYIIGLLGLLGLFYFLGYSFEHQRVIELEKDNAVLAYGNVILYASNMVSSDMLAECNCSTDVADYSVKRIGDYILNKSEIMKRGHEIMVNETNR